MSLRLPGYLLMLALLVVLAVSMSAPSQQSSAEYWPKWEYKVLRLESYTCVSENEVTRQSNILGQQGWEMVGFDHPTPPFPRDAEGTLLIAPAATGSSRGVNPPTADSFEGKLDLKMAQTQPTGCSMIFKRQLRPPAR